MKEKQSTKDVDDNDEKQVMRSNIVGVNGVGILHAICAGLFAAFSSVLGKNGMESSQHPMVERIVCVITNGNYCENQAFSFVS